MAHGTYHAVTYDYLIYLLGYNDAVLLACKLKIYLESEWEQIERRYCLHLFGCKAHS